MGRRERLQTKYQDEASEKDVEKLDKTLSLMKRGPVAKNWSKVETLWRVVKDPRAAWPEKAVAIGALAYLITPLDAVPDVIPIAGFSDDLAIIVAAITVLAAKAREYAVDTARRIAEASAQVKIETANRIATIDTQAKTQKYHRLVTVCAIGAGAIAAVLIAAKIAWRYVQ